MEFRVISGPVGLGGVNRPEDVRLVEGLLTTMHKYKLRMVYEDQSAPGYINPAVIEAILDFQTGSMPVPTGRVDPPTGLAVTDPARLTWERLIRPPLVRLPDAGYGYYYYGKSDRR